MGRQSDLDNHANQLNPNNEEFYNSRGEERPEDWDDDDYDNTVVIDTSLK